MGMEGHIFDNPMQDLFGRGGDISWWQMSLRAVLVAAFGLAIVRLFGRRAFGKRTALDIIVAMIIGSNLSRALTANAPLFETLSATEVLVLCYWGSDHVAARWKPFSRFIKGEPIVLLRHGHLDRNAMRRTGITEGDIEEAARRAGLTGLEKVREAVLERSGEITALHGEGRVHDG